MGMQSKVLVKLDDIAHAMRIPEGVRLSIAAKIASVDGDEHPIEVRCDVERHGADLVIYEPKRPAMPYEDVAMEPEPPPPAPPPARRAGAAKPTPPPPATAPATPDAKSEASKDEKPAASESPKT